MSYFSPLAAVAAPARFALRAPRRPVALAISTLLACAGELALAQNTAGTAADEAQLPTVQVQASTDQPDTPNGVLPLDIPSSTASRLGLSLRETPAAVTVVDRATIEARGASNTQEMLQSVPGITAHDAPGSIGVSYRGFSGSSLNQLFNGINVQYGIAARPVDSWIYEQMEAIGGASSFLYGAGGVGGTINYITKLAQRQDLTEAQLRLGSYATKEASFGINRRIAGDGKGAGSHYLRLDLNHKDGNSWTQGTHSKATQLAASLLSDFGGGVSHTLAYEYQHERVDRPYWGTPLRNPVGGALQIDEGTRFKNYNSQDGMYAQKVQWLRSLTDWRVNEQLQFKNTFYAYNALRDYRNVEVYKFTSDNSQVVRSSALLQRHQQRLVGNRIDGQYQGLLAGLRSDWSFGLDVSLNKQTRFPNSLSGTVSTVDPYDFDPGYFYDTPGMTPGFRPDRENKVTTMALYAENRTSLTPRLHLVSALRHERIDLELTNRRDITATSPASFSRSYQPTTGRLALVWDVAPGANLYAQYATAADPPSGVLTTASFADVRNNSALTTGRQLELGSKLDFWQGKGSATVALYQLQRKNFSTQDPSNTSQTLLVGQQTSRGLELAMGLQPTRQWSLQGNVALVDAQYDEYMQNGVSLAGKTPTNTPRVVANLWTSYTVNAQWQLNAGLRHVGKVYADNANTQTWGAYTLLDLGLRYQLSRNATLTARVRNVTDKVYALNVGTQAYLGAPRTAELALRLRF
ncbi:TonB-dependent receptor [Comamonas sp. GB3 AK4-5]|uniref:TonB-dependent receptor n=1 Tax=Comamonas sp. GB3 AK4-5 TaxID=3231487 RepID=UPI00351F71F0